MKCIVFGGGAEKGISYIGALKFLEEKNIIYKNGFTKLFFIPIKT